MLLLYLFIFVMFAAMFTLLAVAAAPALISIGADWFYFLLFIGIDVSLVFIFGVFETKSEIFECRDNELLLSMPIKPRDIVISRVLSVIIWNYVESLVVFLPAIIVYGVMGGSYLGVIGSSVVLLFLPLLPTALSCLVGFAVSLIAAKFKKKTFTTVIIFFAFFAAYMFGYSALVEGMEAMLLNVSEVASTVGRFAFLRVVGSAAMLKPLPLLLLCIASVLSSACAVLAISSAFSRIVSTNKGGKRAIYRAKREKRRSPLFSLVRKELSRFFTSSTYIINSSLGVIFAGVIAVVALINKDMLLPLAEAFGALLGADAEALLCVTLVSAIGLCSSLSYISACSLSLEGKSLWIMKSMPVSGREVLTSKTLCHIIITAPVTLAASVLVCIATGIYSLAWYFIIAPQLINAVCALAGILFNTAFPRFDFANEASVIKNSTAVFLTMMSVMIFSLGIAALGVWLSTLLAAGLVALIGTALLLVAVSCLAWLLLGAAVKKYERI